jgi:hypothetical protein
MPHVEHAAQSMFEDIYPLLQDFNNPDLTIEKWRRIFDYRWKSDDTHIGNVLIEKGKIVGFLGTLFSSRSIGGRNVRMCNLTSWIVKDGYRSESLRLVMPLLKLRDHTFTNLTLSDRAGAIMKRLGFMNLDTNVRLIFPLPSFHARSGQESVRIVCDDAEVRSILNPVDLQIHADHSEYGCGRVVIQTEDSYCYLLFTRKKAAPAYGRLPFAHIHYISNRSVFLRHLNAVRMHFLKAQKCWLLMVEERLIGNAPVPLSRTRALRVPKMYKSDTLNSSEVDNLYTEMVVLGL